MHLKHLWENYTPEQEREQASWKAAPVFKSPFPGKPKKPGVPKGVPKAAADPFDTKPIPKQP